MCNESMTRTASISIGVSRFLVPAGRLPFRSNFSKSDGFIDQLEPLPPERGSFTNA